MKAQLTFDLPAEQLEFDLACRGSDFCTALTDIAEVIRNKLKYTEMSEQETACWENIRQAFYEATSSHGVGDFL